MNIDSLKKFPGSLMIVPLLIGALLNTVDQMHLAPVEAALKALGAPPVETVGGEVYYELLSIGGFTSALTKHGALPLIGAFLVCVAAQLNFRTGRRALKKGAIITTAKLVAAIGTGYLIGALTDPFDGFLGLSTVAIIAALSNGNGGLYLALTGQYGNRSDVGAVGVISLNDGPFFTLLALGMLGEKFPFAAFLAVLLPMLVGFALGQWSDEVRSFLSAGEKLLIPFFAFALGTGMNLGHFFNPDVVLGGLFLGLATVTLTGLASVFALRLSGEKSQVAGVAEASTAGNAVQTPFAVAAAALASTQAGVMSPERAAAYEAIVPQATAQISISTLTTALLCPLAVIFFLRRQKARGIDATSE